jgi:hypothetical protein
MGYTIYIHLPAEAAGIALAAHPHRHRILCFRKGLRERGHLPELKYQTVGQHRTDPLRSARNFGLRHIDYFLAEPLRVGLQTSAFIEANPFRKLLYRFLLSCGAFCHAPL